MQVKWECCPKAKAGCRRVWYPILDGADPGWSVVQFKRAYWVCAEGWAGDEHVTPADIREAAGPNPKTFPTLNEAKAYAITAIRLKAALGAA